MNPMRDVRIEKITLNIGVGQPGDKLDKATKLLSTISGLKAVQTKTMKRIPTWGLRPNLPLGTKVTIRGKKAFDLLGRLFKAGNNKIKETKFDQFGNFSFGVEEYINIPGVEYDPEVGVIGLEVAVTLSRSGYRIKIRKNRRNKIGLKHKVTKQDAIEFVKKAFKVEVELEE